MVEDAHALATRLGDAPLIGFVLGMQTLFNYAYMEFTRAIDAGRQASRLLREAGDLWNLCQVLGFELFSLAFSGRFEEAAEIEDEAESMAARIGHLGSQALSGRARAFRHFMASGDFEERARWIDEDEELFRLANLPWVGQAYTLRAQTAFLEGRWDESLSLAVEGARTEPPGALQHWGAGQLLLIRAYRGERDEALQLLADHEQDLAVPGRPASWGSFALTLAAVEALAMLGERDRAAALYPVAQALDDRGVVLTGLTQVVPAAAGIAAAAAGRLDGAHERFSRALGLADTLPLRPFQPDVRRHFAQMLLDRDAAGDRERARTLLEEAIEGCARLGMPRHEELARALLARA